jgi:hypothetical protein
VLQSLLICARLFKVGHQFRLHPSLTCFVSDKHHDLTPSSCCCCAAGTRPHYARWVTSATVRFASLHTGQSLRPGGWIAYATNRMCFCVDWQAGVDDSSWLLPMLCWTLLQRAPAAFSPAAVASCAAHGVGLVQAVGRVLGYLFLTSATCCG